MKFCFFLLFLFVGDLSSETISISRNFREGYHPKFLKNSKTRVNDYPILSVETFRASADFILDETVWTIETDDLFDGCVLFVGLRSLKDFTYKVLPYIKNKIVIITHAGEPFHHISSGLNWDSYVKSSSYLTPILVNHPNVLAVFGKNIIYNHPKSFPIPLGKFHWYPKQSPIIKKVASQITRESFFKDKKISVFVNGAITHSTRGPVFSYWKKQKGTTFIAREPWNKYFEHLKNSKFVLSPRGYGIDCFRTWEALYAGAIPVVESWGIDSLYQNLPVIIVKDLTKVTLEDLEEEYEKLKSKNFNLDKLFADYWINKFHFYKN